MCCRFGNQLNLFRRKTSFRTSYARLFELSNFNSNSDGFEVCGQSNYSIYENESSVDINDAKIEKRNQNISSAKIVSFANYDQKNAITVTPFDGVYKFSLDVVGVNFDQKIHILLQVKGPHGYLSKTELPILYVHFTTASLLLLSLLFLFSSCLFGSDKPSAVHIAIFVLTISEFLKNIISAFNFYRSSKGENSIIHLIRSSVVFGSLADALFRFVFLLLASGLGQFFQHNFNLKSSFCLTFFYFLTSVLYEDLSPQNKSDYAIEILLLIKYVIEAMIAYFSISYITQTWQNLKHQVVCSAQDRFFRFLTVVKICAVFVAVLHVIIIWSYSSTFCDIGWFLSWFQIAVWSALRVVFVVATTIIYNNSYSWDLMNQGTMMKQSKTQT